MTRFATTHILRGLFGIALLLGLAGTAHAQTIIEPGPPGTFNNFIAGDTTATGERNTCHYVLRRGAFYIYTERVRLEGDCDWIIEGEAGSGDRPVIKPAAVPGGDEAPRPFQAYTEGATITLRSLHLDGYDTAVPDPGRPSDNAPIRASADSLRFIIDDVRIDRNRQSAFRTDGSHTKWYISNSQLTNIYNTNRPDQSYSFDTRGVEIDSIVIVNTSWWNLTAHPIQAAGNARIKYLKIDHNTFVNVGGWPNAGGQLDTLRAELPGEQNYGVVDFGQTEYAVFRNNLLLNAGFVGTHTDDVFTPRYVVNIDSMVTELDSVTFQVVPPKGVDVRNNVIGLSASLASAYPDSIRMFTSDEFYDPTFDLFIAAMGSASTLQELVVDLASAPTAPLDVANLLYRIVNENPDPQPPVILPRDTRNVQDPEGTLDLSYATSSPAYTAGTDNMPVGDLNWFGMAAGYTSAPDQFATVTTSTETADLPDGFRVLGNYPNPFNPATTIRFELPASAAVSVEVFDMLGRQVLSVPAQTFVGGGAQSLVVDGASLASGAYVYRVRADLGQTIQFATGRMVLVK